MKARILFVTGILFLLGGAGVFFFLQKDESQTPGVAKKCPYAFINQLRCEPELATKKKEYVVLQNELIDFITAEKKKGTVTHVSIYFRDLQNGPTMNIHGQENFAPASLLKVPLMITYYKKAETDPKLLQRKIRVSDVKSLPQNIQPEQSLKAGKEYTVADIIRLMIAYSDNTSWEALLVYLRQKYSEEDFVMTLSDLGIIDPRKRNDQQYITVQSYASIFRILYNSSYLSIPMSDKALRLLTDSSFKNGLTAGVPSGIKIAHKFGEQKNGNEQQVHDCGIVYYTPNPYLLCVMTKGNSIVDLERVIQTVSKEVYQEVESRN